MNKRVIAMPTISQYFLKKKQIQKDVLVLSSVVYYWSLILRACLKLVFAPLSLDDHSWSRDQIHSQKQKNIYSPKNNYSTIELCTER